MITIALDEKGEFERAQDNSEATYIAGMIYDDNGDENDTKNEMLRLSSFFRKACLLVGAKYPKDMHVSGYNHASVARVKEQIRAGLPEFIQKGTFQGEEIVLPEGGTAVRTGTYHFFAIVKSSEGKKELLGPSVSALVKDDFASNLYLHMAEEVICRVLFQNPVIRDVNKVRIDLATRRVVLTGEDKNRASEYAQLNYREVDQEYRVAEESREFVLTTPDVYRTAIEREMMNAEQTHVQVESIKTRSISYYPKNPEKMAFLHLADIICSHMGYKMQGTTPREWLDEIVERLDCITGTDNNLVFAYDSIDGYYERALNQYQAGDYYKTLSIVYDALHIDSECTDYYRDKWFHKLITDMEVTCDCSLFTMAVRKLAAASRNNNVNIDRMKYILDQLLEMETNVKFPSGEDKVVLYDLYNTAARILNQSGLSEQAEGYLQKAKQYHQYIGVEQLLSSRNKQVVASCDQFNYETAKLLVKENLECYDMIFQVRKQLTSEADVQGIGYAIALSQAGQVYSYLRREKAEQYFLKALEEFEENTPNYMITLSYLLHHYLDMKNQVQFEKYMAIYMYGEMDLEKQLISSILENGAGRDTLKSLKYFMYLYVKSLYVFYMDQISEPLLKKLLDIRKTFEKTLPDAVLQMCGHPWQLIYKYLAFIAYDKGHRDIAEGYMRAIEMAVGEYDDILKAMIDFGRAEYAHLMGNQHIRDEAAYSAWKEIMEVSEELPEQRISLQEAYDKVSEKMTYMYR